MSQYITEFFIIAAVHFFAVASPGPDFAIIVKQSLTRGRKIALYTSLGIGTAIFLHVTYSLLGIGLLIKSDPLYFNILTYIAAAYLFYIGVMSIQAKASQKSIAVEGHKKTQSFIKAFSTGFLVNGLNVKATLFFVSVFSTVVSQTTPMAVQAIYGVYMAVATAIWFSFLSVLLTLPGYQQKLTEKGHIIDRIMGVILIALAIKIVVG